MELSAEQVALEHDWRVKQMAVTVAQAEANIEKMKADMALDRERFAQSSAEERRRFTVQVATLIVGGVAAGSAFLTWLWTVALPHLFPHHG